MYLKVIDQKRKKILKDLGFLNKYKFYLAGGTALALQIGHRISVDFDFYTQKNFDPNNIINKLKNKFQIEVIMLRDNTLGVIVDNVEINFFRYPYKLIDDLTILEKIKIASIKDIAAMKIIAIAQRGTQRDFVDIYYLLQKHNVLEILRWVNEKYPEISIPLCLKALVYFKDAEENKESKKRIKIFDNDFNWKKAKKFIEKQIFSFQKNEV
jgi:predicted nucleotidyltransferase component of viral defense system